MKAVLKFVTKEKTFSVPVSYGHKVVIGRGTNYEYTLNDSKVSTDHCTFVLADEYLRISDNKSKNGTYLNGIRIDAAEMFIGDEVKIGDTIITLDEQMMDAKTIADLTFPGPAKQRIAYELRVDFTGARIQNQLFNHANPDKHNHGTPSRAKEIDLRKRAKTKIKLSKEEIKFRHQKLTQKARFMDGILLLVIFLAPALYIFQASQSGGIPFLGMTAESVLTHRANLIGGSQLLFTGCFLLFNMRLAEFSLGEKLMGIERIYEDQDF